MNTSQFISEVIKRIRKRKVLVIITALIFGILLGLYAFTKKPVYTAKSTVFPLTSPSDNPLSSSSLSNILGLSDAPKSFSSEATINIIELALSRNVRESVASVRLPEFDNKKIAELITDEINSKKLFYSKKTNYPTDSTDQAILGGILLEPYINAKMSKNGVLELYYSSTNEKMVRPVSEVIISKISQFYVDLKVKKAIRDYKFTLGKIDSLQQVLNGLDQRAINMQNSTFFTPDRLEYEIPKDNLSTNRQRTESQRNLSLNNREEALWRLQKATPIIEVLDKPTPPYDVKKPFVILFVIVGFVFGALIGIFIITFRLIVRFIKDELKKALLGNDIETNASASQVS